MFVILYVDMEIYGIAGLKQHGKDTLANHIKQYNDKFEIVHFADEVKKMASSIFAVPIEYFADPILKEHWLQDPIVMDIFLSHMRRETGLNIERQDKIARSPRQLLQFFGTEYVRKAKDNYWIDVVKNIILESNNKNFLIPDVRYPNEEQMLRSLDGKIIKVERIDLPFKNDGHISEKPELINEDLMLGFVTGDFSLHRLVGSLIACNLFNHTFKFDFTHVINSFLTGAESKTYLKYIYKYYNLENYNAVELTG